jgi:hypothetical protein
MTAITTIATTAIANLRRGCLARRRRRIASSESNCSDGSKGSAEGEAELIVIENVEKHSQTL